MTDEEHKALVVRPSTAVGRVGAGAGSVLSRVVSDALILARSHSLASARFRVGSYEFREADYQQILLWAKALENTPEKIIEALENTTLNVDGRLNIDDHDVISFQVRNGSISSLVWDNEKLPLTEFMWVKDLKICEIAFIHGFEKLTAISCRLPALRRLVCADEPYSENRHQLLLNQIFGDGPGKRYIGLRELDLSNVPRLTELCCCGNNELTQLDLSNVRELAQLVCEENRLTKLDFSNVPELSLLRCYDNQLTELDLSNVPKLAELVCGGNQLTKLDLSNVPRLAGLWCAYNQLTELDLSNVPELACLICEGNQLTELDLSVLPELTELNCSGNKITELDVRQNRKLKVLECDPSVSIRKPPSQEF